MLPHACNICCFTKLYDLAGWDWIPCTSISYDVINIIIIISTGLVIDLFFVLFTNRLSLITLNQSQPAKSYSFVKQHMLPARGNISYFNVSFLSVFNHGTWHPAQLVYNPLIRNKPPAWMPMNGTDYGIDLTFNFHRDWLWIVELQTNHDCNKHTIECGRTISCILYHIVICATGH